MWCDAAKKLKRRRNVGHCVLCVWYNRHDSGNSTHDCPVIFPVIFCDVHNHIMHSMDNSVRLKAQQCAGIINLLKIRVRPIRVKWPMSDVPIFRRKNSDVLCRCLVGTVTSVDVDKSRAQAYAFMPASYIANYSTLLYYC